MAELRRQSPVHVGPIDLGDGARRGRPVEAPAGDGLRIRRGGPGPAGQRDLLLHGVRGDHGRGDGPDHPADGRARAPPAPGPGVADLPLQGARAVGGRPGPAGGQRAHRRLRRPGYGRPGPGADLQLPRPGHRPDPRAAPLRLPHVPALGHRDHQRGLQLGAGRGRLGGPPRLLRRRAGRAAPPAGRRPDQRAAGGRGGRPHARRRGDLLLPPAAAAGRGGDHLPGLGEHALRAADQSRPAASGARTTAP